MGPQELGRRKRVVRFIVGCLLASVAYLLAHAQIMRWIEQDPAAPRNPWLAAVPIVALLAAMVLAMRSVRGMDELERSIHTEAMAFGFLVSLLLICSAGFLALAGLVTLSLDWIAPAMVLSWVVGLLLAIMRYR